MLQEKGKHREKGLGLLFIFTRCEGTYLAKRIPNTTNRKIVWMDNRRFLE